MPKIVTKTDLTRKTREILALVERHQVVTIESYGKECAAILDILTYHLLIGLIKHLSQFANADFHPADQVDELISAYLNGEISLEDLAQHLDVSPYDIVERLDHLGLSVSAMPHISPNRTPSRPQ